MTANAQNVTVSDWTTTTSHEACPVIRRHDGGTGRALVSAATRQGEQK